MRKDFIIIGYITKRLLFPFLHPLFQIIINFYTNYFIKILSFRIMSIGIGQMAILILPNIKMFSDKTENIKHKNKSLTIKKIFLYFLLILIYAISIALVPITMRFRPKSAESGNVLKSQHTSGLYSMESVEAIFITIASILLLKKRYFNHHAISLIFIIILSFIIDFCLDNYDFKEYEDDYKKIIKYYSLYLIQLITDSLCLTYKKYMMDIFYYPPYNIMFVLGLFLFILGIVLLILNLVTDVDNSNLFINFSEYFSNNNIILTILIYLGYILLQFFLGILAIYTLYYFSPNHILISLQIAKMFDLLLAKKSNYYSIIPFIIQFFFLMIFLEILELNFCGLNKNTKINIQKREKEEMLLKDEEISNRDSLKEVAPGYMIRISDVNTDNTNESDENDNNNDKDNENNNDNGIELGNNN